MISTRLVAAARLSIADALRLSSIGIRTRKLRAGLSALGIAIGVAAIVAVLGLSSSSEAGLLAEINQLGTNLLEVTNGQTLFGQTAELPIQSPGMIGRIGPVTDVQYTGSLSNLNAFRSPLIPSIDTNALSVDATSLGLPKDVGAGVRVGHFLNAATANEPVCVLGAAAAQRLGIDKVFSGERIWVGNMWFYVIGILNHSVLTPEVDSEVLIGFPAAEKYFNFDGHPSEVYVRTVKNSADVNAVDGVLAATANPESPSSVDVSQPSAALVAQADAQAALNGLFLGLGAVALLVGAVGVANIMVISVLERRSEIGLRRALGATPRTDPHAVPLRGDAARADGWCRRSRARRDFHRRVRLGEALGDRRAGGRLGRRAWRGDAHRRDRRTLAGDSGGPALSDRSTLEPVTERGRMRAIRRARPVAIGAAVVVVGLIVAACGGASGPGVASLGGSTTTTIAATSETASPTDYAKDVQYAAMHAYPRRPELPRPQCPRRFPDPWRGIFETAVSEGERGVPTPRAERWKTDGRGERRGAEARARSLRMHAFPRGSELPRSAVRPERGAVAPRRWPRCEPELSGFSQRDAGVPVGVQRVRSGAVTRPRSRLRGAAWPSRRDSDLGPVW